jgi:hypothetical protein
MTITRQRLGKHARNTPTANNTAEGVFSIWSAPRPFARQLSGSTPLQQKEKRCFLCYEICAEDHVEARSSTSIVTLRVIGGDEKEVSNLRQ